MVYRHILNFWPLVPAVDIQAIMEAVKANEDKVFQDFDAPFGEFQNKQLRISESETDETVNVLIVGDAFGCLIKTITRMYRYGTLNLNIYVVSCFPESHTRNLLLLSLFNDTKMGISERAEMFLEIFGNTLIRTSTAAFVETRAGQILEDVVSFKQTMASVPSAVSLTLLKQKEVDDICTVLSFLKSCGSYDIAKAWENSLRAYFGTRYDNRCNWFDYNYNMKLSHYPIINLKRYLQWCESGIAFKLRKGRYDHPNKTLCVNSLEARMKSPGFYVGDITTSPYIAYGVECKNEEMFQKVNDQYVNTSVDISKFNVIDLMLEFGSSKNCVDKKLNVYFLFHNTFCNSKKFEDFFDAVYVTCDMTCYAENQSLNKNLKRGGMAVFETVNSVVNSTKEQKKKHLEDMDRLATLNNLKLDATLKSTTENFRVYTSNK